jgi:hypothetical protein
MTQQHPITPPPELVQEWWADFNGAFYEFEAITANVFQAGADQELEACCEWIADWYGHGCNEVIDNLRTSRRPEPPSLKEQALEALDEEQAELSIQNYKLIRAVLESLPDHE